MEKKLLFSLLFGLLGLFFNPAYGFGAPKLLATIPNLIESCDAPPPDSFRVTSFSYNVVTLAWEPFAVGDDHLLTFFGENTSNGWDSLYSVELFGATSYTVANMNPAQKHKVQIRTVCKDGTLGTVSPPLIPPHGVILELVLFGDPPKIPEVVDCHKMYYTDPQISWVGFKISRPDVNEGEISNFFQFEKVNNDPDVEARLKRVETENVLVAANLVGEYPTNFINVVNADMLFMVGEVENGTLSPIGFVLMTIHGGGTPSVDICKLENVPSRPWNPLYQFDAIIERNPPICNGCPPTGERNLRNKHKDVIRVQNPVSDYLNIFFTQALFLGGTKKYTLLDISGKTIFQEQFKVTEPQIAIPIDSIVPGLYFLHVESEDDVQTVKVVIN